MQELVIRIPHVPDKRLNPNEGYTRMHRYKDGETKASLARTLKESARLTTYSTVNRSTWRTPDGDLALRLHIAWPSQYADKFLPDDDNAISSCKALIDGIAAGLGINDRRLKYAGIEQSLDPEGAGYVLATITPR